MVDPKRIGHDHPAYRPTWMHTMMPMIVLGIAFVVEGPKWFGLSIDDRLTQDIVAAHVRSLMADHLTEIHNSNHHVVKPWFNGHLDFAPPVIDCSDQGFRHAGGRLDSIYGHSAPAIMYYSAAHPINLFVWPETSIDSTDEKKMT